MRKTHHLGTLVATTAALVCMAAACAGHRHPQPPPTDVARSHSGGVATATDRERLAALAAQRRHETGMDGGYRIGADDLLQIQIPDLMDAVSLPTAGTSSRPADGGPAPVSGVPTFAEGVRVSADGDVTVPLLGQVRAEGLTPTELEREIASRLVARRILKQPQVSVNVVEYRSRTVAVVGAVEHPGDFPTSRPGGTISDFVWAAGGPSKDAGRVVEFTPVESNAHDGDGATRAPIRIDLMDMLQGSGDAALALTVPVRPGDVITIAPAGNVTVEGWVDKPGAYPVTRGLSVAGAVAAAGGPSFAANRHDVTLRHPSGQQRIDLDLDAIANGTARDVPVRDGDVVDVPASTVRLVPWGAWSAIKNLFWAYGSVAF